jgi:hypothetical protein
MTSSNDFTLGSMTACKFGIAVASGPFFNRFDAGNTSIAAERNVSNRCLTFSEHPPFVAQYDSNNTRKFHKDPLNLESSLFRKFELYLLAISALLHKTTTSANCSVTLFVHSSKTSWSYSTEHVASSLANSSAKSRTTARSSNVANAASFDDELLLVCNVSVSSFFFPLLSRCSLSSPLSVNRSAIASFLVNKNLPRRPPLLKTNKDSDGPFFFFFFFREALRSSRHPRGGKVFVCATAAVVVVFPTEEEEHALVADERNILFESFFSRLSSR